MGDDIAASGSDDVDVLVVGAGPTGLALGVWLAHQGVRLRIIDRRDAPAPFSRALGMQARTLEFYQQLGFADDVVSRGTIARALRFHARGRVAAEIPLGRIGMGLSPFPFVLDLAQDQHERILADQLASRGVTVDRGLTLASFEQDADRVTAVLRDDQARASHCRARYIAGCDGVHSVVRQGCGIALEGGTYQRTFYVADVEAQGPVADGNLHVDVDTDDILAVFPMDGKARIRLVGTVRDDSLNGGRDLQFADVSERIIASLALRVDQVNWFSTYRVHHRVATAFRSGRAFLLGDAAHVHSPVGAQGMNTGIGDAVNLAWKLAAVLQGRAGDHLLDSYEPERIAFARKLVTTTDRIFTLASSPGRVARFLRTRVVPPMASLVMRSARVRRFLFRTVSQLAIAYHDSPLSAGRAGALRGGDRLPWLGAFGIDNFAPLTSFDWQVHVYGDGERGLVEACASLGAPLHIFPWSDAVRRAGFARDAAYLIRPDGYVALALATGDAQMLRAYVERIGRPTR